MKNSSHTNTYHKMLPIVAVIILFAYNGLYGQLIGDRSVNLGDVETYTLVRGDVTYAEWDAGGVITSSNNTSATVRWNIPGTQSLVVVFETMGVSGNFSIVEIEVSVASVPTAAPGAPSISDNGCGQALLTRNGSPPEDVDWYWQGKNPNGTHINKGKGDTFVANEGTGTYYIRAYHTGSAQWSTSSGSRYVSIVNLGAGSITGTQTICYNGNPGTLGNSASASGVSGSVAYQWQYSNTGSSGWTNISGATGTTYDPPSGLTVSRSYRRRAQCASQTRYTDPVTVTVIPALSTPTLASTVNNCGETVLTMGTTPAGEIWYWQNTFGGKSRSNSTNSVIRTSGTVYYLRARSDSEDCWGTSLIIDYTVNQNVTWYLDADGDGHASDSRLSCGSPGIGWTDQPMNVDDCNDNAHSPANDCSTPTDLLDQNYVYTRTYQGRTQQPYVGYFVEHDSIVQNITYFDGLGRPMQETAIKQTPKDGNGVAYDIVTHIAYDDYGRQVMEWLPYPDLNTATAMGSYRPNTAQAVEMATKQYYWDHYADDFPGIVNIKDITAYSEKEFEPSPLNRVQKQAAPGHDWAMGQGHEIVLDYATNNSDDRVRQFEVTVVPVTQNTVTTYVPSLIENGDYGVAELFKNSTYDENHTTGKNHSVEEFTNKQGQVVLKRTYADIPPMDRNGDGDTTDPGEEARPEEPHDTYYVYDDYGNLSYVLPPKMEGSSATLAEINSAMDELGYQYVYDHRDRLVEKKLPGKGWEHIIYNKLDQPIMTRDPNLRVQGQWLFTKYDAHGRVAYTGMVSSTSSRIAHQTAADQVTKQYESPLAATTKFESNTISVYYGNDAYPKTDISKIHTVNYYGGYVDANGLSVPTEVLEQATASNVKGLATVSRVRVLDPSAGAGQAHWITTLTGYDAKGRAIYTASKNTYLNTVDIVETELDFVGRSLKVRSAHTRTLDGVEGTIVTIDNFAYDHVGRLLSQTQCIGDATLGDTCNSAIGDTSLVLSTPVTGSRTDIATSSIILRPGFHVVAAPGLSYTAKIDPQFAQELIVYNNYDELGQLVRKKVGGSPGATYDATMGLQTVKYAYNVRGWLTQINNPTSLGSDLFAFGINYNTVAHGGTPLYNGNISETEWRTANTDSSLKWYRYGYDALNRITGATANSSNYSLSGITYDKNGNLQSLTRRGHTNAGATSFGNMDILDYDYHNSEVSNRLYKVNDTGSNNYGFKDSSANNQDYWYDGNGNMVRDLNKGIGTSSVDGITYNHLNLPEEVKFDNSSTKKIGYIYDALGTKLKKMTYDNGVLTTTDYAGNYIYENNALQFFSHPEGYVNVENNGYRYVYQYKDHLGNVRLTYADSNDDGTIDASTEIISEKNYYPFGLQHRGYNNVINGTENNYEHYQSQEWTEDLGLDMHEWKYRFSDPAIGRFISVDPLAEDYPYNSTYAFQENKLGMGTELEGAELNPFPWMVQDAATNPNGVGAHSIGITQGLANTVTNAANFVTTDAWKADTWKGLGNLLLSGNPKTMEFLDSNFGTDTQGALDNFTAGVNGAMDDLANGNGIERGTVIGEIAGAVIGTKGVTAGMKGLTTVSKSVNLSSKLTTSEGFLIKRHPSKSSF